MKKRSAVESVKGEAIKDKRPLSCLRAQLGTHIALCFLLICQPCGCFAFYCFVLWLLRLLLLRQPANRCFTCRLKMDSLSLTQTIRIGLIASFCLFPQAKQRSAGWRSSKRQKTIVHWRFHKDWPRIDMRLAWNSYGLFHLRIEN